MSDVPPPLLITGIPHSGTRVFLRIVRHSGRFMGTDLNDQGDARAFQPWARTWVRPYWRARLRGDPPADAMLAEFMEAQDRHRAELADPSAPWGYKQPRSLFLVPFLHAVHPGLRVLHVMRDGRDFARNGWGKIGPLRFEDLLLDASELAQPVAVRRVLVWAHWNEIIADYAQRELGDRHLIVRLEDLCADPAPTIRRVLAFTGAKEEVTSAMLAEVRPPDSVGRWQHLDDALRESTTVAARPWLSRFGYLTYTPAGMSRDPATSDRPDELAAALIEQRRLAHVVRAAAAERDGLLVTNTELRARLKRVTQEDAAHAKAPAAEVEELRDRLDAVAAARTALEVEHEQLLPEVERLRADTAVRVRKLERLRRKAAGQNAEIERLREAVDAAALEIAHLGEAVASGRTEVAHLRETARERDAEIVRLTSAVEQALGHARRTRISRTWRWGQRVALAFRFRFRGPRHSALDSAIAVLDAAAPGRTDQR